MYSFLFRDLHDMNVAMRHETITVFHEQRVTITVYLEECLLVCDTVYFGG